jgi:hypothetical protein
MNIRASKPGHICALLAVVCCAIPMTLCAQAKTGKVSGGEEKLISLFDGKSLGSWKSTNFGGEGKVSVKNGQIIIEMGSNISGITWNGAALPKINYEISLEAMKLQGDDFFCGLTFPVGDDPCSLIVGGWGGSVVGLSSINGMDASENETTQIMNFAQNQWYRIRLRVTPGKIEAWINDKSVVDLATKGKRISIRPEVELSRPLGIANWLTEAALRNISLRKLD